MMACDSVALAPTMPSPLTPGVPWFRLRCSCGQDLPARPLHEIPATWAAHVARATTGERVTAALVYHPGRRRRLAAS